MTQLPAVRDTLTMGELPDAGAAAEMVLYLGAMDLPGAPRPRVELDGDGNIISVEPERPYLRRIWNDLSRREQGEAVYLGLQKASLLKEGLGDGIQLVVWRAYDRGWWVATGCHGGDDQAFRLWVREAIVPEGASPTEATQLAGTILNLAWLRDNGYRLPDLESIFADRAAYTRWRRVASPLRRLIQNLEHAGDDSRDEIRGQIEALIGDVGDPDKDLEDLDAIRAHPRLPEAVIEISGRDEVGRHIFRGRATDAQLSLLRARTRGSARWLLAGETYGVREMVLVEYRRTPGAWHSRTWTQSSGWSGWTPLSEPPDLSAGRPDGAPLVDEALGIEYYRLWKEEP